MRWETYSVMLLCVPTTSALGKNSCFERLVMYLTGVSNIRDVLPHPRTVGSADF